MQSVPRSSHSSPCSQRSARGRSCSGTTPGTRPRRRHRSRSRLPQTSNSMPIPTSRCCWVSRRIEPTRANRRETASSPHWSACAGRGRLRSSTATPPPSTALRSAPTGASSPPPATMATVRLWNVAHSTGNSANPSPVGHGVPVQSVAFQPLTGTPLASANANGTIRLWDVTTHRELGQPLPGSTSASAPNPNVSTRASIAFSADGHILASATPAGLQLWDVTTHRQLGGPFGRLPRPRPRRNTLAASPSRASPSARMGTSSPPQLPTARSSSGTPTPARNSATAFPARALPSRALRSARTGTHLPGPAATASSSGTSPSTSRLAARLPLPGAVEGIAFSTRKWTHPRLRRRRRHGPALERRHPPATRGISQWPERRRLEHRLQPGRPHPRLRRRRRHGEAVERHQPQSGRPTPPRARRRPLGRRLQPGPAHPRHGQLGRHPALGPHHPPAHRPTPPPSTPAPTRSSPSARTARPSPPRTTTASSSGTSPPTTDAAYPSPATPALSRASPSAPTGTPSPPPACTARSGSGTSAPTSNAANRSPATRASLRSSRSARTGTSSPPRATPVFSSGTSPPTSNSGPTQVPGLIERRFQPGRAHPRRRQLPELRRRRDGSALERHHPPASSANPSPSTAAPARPSRSARTGTHSPPSATSAPSSSGTSPPTSNSANPSSASPRAVVAFAGAVAFTPDGRTVAFANEDRTVGFWKGILWNGFDDLRTQVCDLVWGNLTPAEWELYAQGLPYRTTCPRAEPAVGTAGARAVQRCRREGSERARRVAARPPTASRGSRGEERPRGPRMLAAAHFGQSRRDVSSSSARFTIRSLK